MKESYDKESKSRKTSFSYILILLSYKSKKSIVHSPKYFLLFVFLPNYCIPSDYSVKEELMIANYYIIKW